MLPAINLWTVRQGNDVECRYNFAAGRFHTKKLCSRLLSTEVEFYWQKQQITVCATFGDLGVTYTVHLWLFGKRVVDVLVLI